MRKIILITFCFLFYCCNTNQKNPVKWTDDDKDLVFEECIKYAIFSETMSRESANKYCYCSLDIILEQYENREDALKRISSNPGLVLEWEKCKDNL